MAVVTQGPDGGHRVVVLPTGLKGGVQTDYYPTSGGRAGSGGVMTQPLLGDNTLAKFITGVAISSSATTVDMGEQIGGDATDGTGGAADNLVDAADYSSFLLIPIGTLTGTLSETKQRQDHNRDGLLDIIDYAIMVENFSKVGDSKP